MSTSPRIDAVLGHLAEHGRELCESSCPQALVDEARRIESELTAARERIKQLEEAVKAVDKYLDVLQSDEKKLSYSGWIVALSDAGKAYREAKCKAMEAKP